VLNVLETKYKCAKIVEEIQIINGTLQRDKFAFSQIIKLYLARLNCRTYG